MKVGGAAFDSLALGGHDLDLPDADTLGLSSLHRILAAEVLSARPAKLDVDTTVDKAAAILARMIPPRPKPLRFVIHSEDMSVRFTAGNVRTLGGHQALRATLVGNAARQHRLAAARPA